LVRILTISNILSLLRAPLAVLFLFANTPLRITVLALAALTDWLDGFIARRWGKPTVLGAALDPLMDKFFMIFVFSVLVAENLLGGWEMVAMLARDIVLLGFLAFVALTGAWRTMKPRSLIWGKIATVAQYVFLFVISFGVGIPSPVYFLFVLFAALYLGELVVEYRRK
jgi:CDP-diacylglycerol---glycerol-3-phosphate 3-phosphatidyltransferase